MEFSEPRGLTVIRSLSGHLEVQVLLDVVLFREAGNVELVLLVVRVDQILEDGAGFPESDARIGIFNGRSAAVGIDVDEWGLLDVVVGDETL